MKKTKKLHNTKSVLFSFNDKILINQTNNKKKKREPFVFIIIPSMCLKRTVQL